MVQIAIHDALDPLILSLDVGTSSVRAMLFDALGRAVASSEIQLRYAIRATPDGGAEADAPAVFDLLVQSIDGVLAHAGSHADRIGAVGASCFWHSLLGLDAAGDPVTPIYYWADTRSGAWVDELRAEVDPPALHDRTGCPLHSSFWPPKLRWRRATDPRGVRHVARWCSFAEYAAGKLHGLPKATVSTSMASGTGLLDVRRLTWDAEALALSGIESARLSPLADAADPLEGLIPTYAARWPALARVPWFPALGDGACANVGGGAVGADRLALTIGTSGALRMVVAEPLPAVPDGLWLYRLDRAHGLLGGALSNGGNVMATLRSLCGNDVTSDAWQAAGELAPDAHGLTMLPFFAGERAPAWNPHAHGVVAGLSIATEAKHLLRAGMEAIAFRLALIYQALRPTAAPCHQIVAGGSALLHSPAWLQILADVLDHDLLAPPPDEEASARGAALVALQALGAIPHLAAVPDPAEQATHYTPNPDRHSRYLVALARHRALESLLFPAGTAWSQPS